MFRFVVTWRDFARLSVIAVMLAPAIALGWLARSDDYFGEPIRYAESLPSDAVASLRQRLAAGKAKLVFEPGHGYLKSLLRELGVSVKSQILVFSKTSLQRERIAPRTPRAVYFGDNVYVGWVQGSPIMELSTVDPELGANFYTLTKGPNGGPEIVRQTHECLQCHDSRSFTGGIPGHIFRSVFPDRDGQPILTAGTFVTTDQSPIEERWGGWYVTGRHGAQRHIGNMVFAKAVDPKRNYASANNRVRLESLFDIAPYLTRHSDIVALMVAEHQMDVQNKIARASYETRIALHYEQMLNKELGRPAGERSAGAHSRIKSVCEPLVRALLFSGETKLTAPIVGTAGFSEEFSGRGPFDPQGRSLRQLDLKNRLFQYPCSFVVYSKQFAALPAEARDFVLERLRDVVSGKDQTEPFSHLNPMDRKAIHEILSATLPAYSP